jgi:hypothetical protein
MKGPLRPPPPARSRRDPAEGPPAHVERKAVRADEDPGDARVAGEPARGLGGNGAGEGQLGQTGRPSLGAQGHQVHGDPHVWALAAHVRELVVVERLTAQLHEGISLPFGVGAAVTGGSVTVHDRLEGGVHDLGADLVQVPGQVGAPGCRAAHPEHPGQTGGIVQRPVRVDAGNLPARGVEGVLGAQVSAAAARISSVSPRSMP